MWYNTIRYDDSTHRSESTKDARRLKEGEEKCLLSASLQDGAPIDESFASETTLRWDINSNAVAGGGGSGFSFVFDGVVVFCFLNVLFSFPGAAVARSLLGLKNDVIIVVMASLRIVVRENIELCVGRCVFAQHQDFDCFSMCHFHRNSILARFYTKSVSPSSKVNRGPIFVLFLIPQFSYRKH